MSARREWMRIGREWLVALCAYSLLIAPFGCQLQDLVPDDDTGGTGEGVGLFVNPDLASNTMIAGRDSAGNEVFVYGTRGAGGSIDPNRIESILVRTAAGDEATIGFENGLPIYFKGFDGSTAEARYTDLGNEVYTVEVTLFNAANGQTNTFSTTIDIGAAQANLLAAAQSAAAQIEAVTGIEVPVLDPADAATSKVDQRSLSPLLLGIIVIPLSLSFYTLMLVTGSVLQYAAQATTAAIIGGLEDAFSPLFLFGSLLGDTAFKVTITPLFDVFVRIPDAPIIIVD